MSEPLVLARMDLASDLAQAEEPLVLLSAVSQLEDRLVGTGEG